MVRGNVAPNPPENDDRLLLLTGAGASAFLGLRTLESIVDPIMGVRISLNDKVSDTIQNTWKVVKASRGKSATFEEVIGQLKKYLECAKLMADDHVFKLSLGQIPSQVTTGEFARIWEDAVIECYRILLEHYGPGKIKAKVNTEEFHKTIELLISLANLNQGRLHIFTTNYDCTYHVIASHTDKLSFITHIENLDEGLGHFRDVWYYMRPDLSDKDLPLIYLHRLHGCVAWFSRSGAPYGLHEVFGAGSELEITDSSYLNRMCIKLVSSEQIGTNPAFSLAFNEFYDQLKSCKALLVWGHSFRDVQVLRTIKNASETREPPFELIYIDPYLSEEEAIRRIRITLAGDPLGVGIKIKPRNVPWITNDGYEKLIAITIDTVNKVLSVEK